MSSAALGLAAAVFAASAVEAVEALTVVLALGSSRGWRSALIGAAAALGTLAALTAAAAPVLTSLPIDVLRLSAGGLLLIFGLQWLRKATLRAAGLKDLHDEEEAFREEVEAARAEPAGGGGLDGYSFTLAFKTTLLEGLEVVLIVLTFGANQGRTALAAASAVTAVLAVIAAGIAARRPLARVPENSLKLGVGVMLCSFGAFWGAEGAGADWPGGDAAIPALILLFGLTSLGLIRLARRQGDEARGTAGGAGGTA